MSLISEPLVSVKSRSSSTKQMLIIPSIYSLPDDGHAIEVLVITQKTPYRVYRHRRHSPPRKEAKLIQPSMEHNPYYAERYPRRNPHPQVVRIAEHDMIRRRHSGLSRKRVCPARGMRSASLEPQIRGSSVYHAPRRRTNMTVSGHAYRDLHKIGDARLAGTRMGASRFHDTQMTACFLLTGMLSSGICPNHRQASAWLIATPKTTHLTDTLEGRTRRSQKVVK